MIENPALETGREDEVPEFDSEREAEDRDDAADDVFGDDSLDISEYTGDDDSDSFQAAGGSRCG